MLNEAVLKWPPRAASKTKSVGGEPKRKGDFQVGSYLVGSYTESYVRVTVLGG